VIKPEDDYFHERNDSPYWNESAWFSFSDPARSMNGLIYFWHRPNLNLTQAGVAAWDTSGRELHDCLFYEFDHFQPLPPDANMYDFTADCGLTVRCLEPQKHFELTYKSAGCEFNLDWTSIMEPLETPRVTEEVLDRTCEGWGKGHYEQGGKVRGQVVLDDEVYNIDSFGVRDHTWGVRRMYHDMPRQGYEWGIADENTSFLIHAVNGLSPHDDDLDNTVEDQFRGWHIKDGIRSDMNQGSRRVVERAADGRPLRVVVEGVDELGRELHTEGVCENWLRYPCHVFWLDNWCLTRWDLHGRTAWGETQDFVQLQQNRRYLRKMRAQGRR
jgi:hypothetical protein